MTELQRMASLCWLAWKWLCSHIPPHPLLPDPPPQTKTSLTPHPQKVVHSSQQIQGSLVMKDGLPWECCLETEVSQMFAQSSHALPLERPAEHKTHGQVSTGEGSKSAEYSWVQQEQTDLWRKQVSWIQLTMTKPNWTVKEANQLNTDDFDKNKPTSEGRKSPEDSWLWQKQTDLWKLQVS